MNSNYLIEGIGYIGSALIALSMLMTSVKKLRIINTVGSVIFVIYALLISSYPTAAMNIFLVFVNIYNLIKLDKDSKNFTVSECYKDESLIQLYLNSNIEDILKYFPNFDSTPSHRLAFLVSNKSEPIGIMIGKMVGETSFEIELDYTIPTYRDYSVGTYLYNYLENKWYASEFIYSEENPYHTKYLLSVGFVKDGNKYIRKSK